MHLSLGKINNVVQELRARARDDISKYVDKTLPEEMELALARSDNILKGLHKDLEDKTMTKRDRYIAMQLINQYIELKLEILGAGVLANQLQSSHDNNKLIEDTNSSNSFSEFTSFC